MLPVEDLLERALALPARRCGSPARPASTSSAARSATCCSAPRPADLDFVARGRRPAALAGAVRRPGDRPRALRHRLGSRRRARVRRRRDPHRDLRPAGRAARRRARPASTPTSPAATSPSTRSRSRLGGPDAGRLRSAPRRGGGPRGRRPARAARRARSSTTRRGSCGWPATPGGWASRSSAGRPRGSRRGRAGGALDTVSGPRIGAELALLAADAAGRGRLRRADARSDAGDAIAPGLSGSTPSSRRARSRSCPPTAAAIVLLARRSRAAASSEPPALLDRLGFTRDDARRGARRRSARPRRSRAGRRGLRDRRRVSRRPSRPRSPARSGPSEEARRWLDGAPPRRARHQRARTCSPRARPRARTSARVLAALLALRLDGELARRSATRSSRAARRLVGMTRRERQRAALRPARRRLLRGLVPHADRPRERASARGSATRCSRPPGSGREPTCSLWFLAMDPATAAPVAPQGDLPDRRLPRRRATRSGSRIGDATLDERRACAARSRTSPGICAGPPPGGAYRHVHPLLEHGADRQDRAHAAPRRRRRRRARCASAAASSCSTARAAARRTCGAPSTPRRWAWVHANDFGADGGRPGRVRRRRLGVRPALRPRGRAEHAGRRRASAARTSLDRARGAVARATPSRFALTELAASRPRDGGRRLVGEVDAAAASCSRASPTRTPTASWPTATTPRSRRCASSVWEDGRRSWRPSSRPGRAHFEYAQREPVPGVPLLLLSAPGHIALDLPGRAPCSSPSRRGGVSAGPYASLNLGAPDRRRPARPWPRTARRVAARDRRRRCVQGHQVHGTAVVAGAERRRAVGGRGRRAGHRAARRRAARPHRRLPPDRASPAPRRRGDAPRRLARPGRRRHRRGRRARCASSAADGPLAAAIGPGAGPCCYEMGDEVHAAFAPHGDAVARAGRNLDLKAVARLRARGGGRRGASRTSGSARSAATPTLVLPPPRRRHHRPPGGRRMAELIDGARRRSACARTSPRCARRSPRRRARAGRDAGRRRDPRRGEVRPRRGSRDPGRGGPRPARREPRAGPRRQEGRRRRPGTFTWDFIGQLQSRKVKAILPLVRLIHSVASDSALAQLERHATGGTEVLARGQRRGGGRARRASRPTSCPRISSARRPPGRSP